MKKSLSMAGVRTSLVALTVSPIYAASTFKIGGLAALQLSYGKSMTSGAKLAIDGSTR